MDGIILGATMFATTVLLAYLQARDLQRVRRPATPHPLGNDVSRELGTVVRFGIPRCGYCGMRRYEHGRCMSCGAPERV